MYRTQAFLGEGKGIGKNAGPSVNERISKGWRRNTVPVVIKDRPEYMSRSVFCFISGGISVYEMVGSTAYVHIHILWTVFEVWLALKIVRK